MSKILMSLSVGSFILLSFIGSANAFDDPVRQGEHGAEVGEQAGRWHQGRGMRQGWPRHMRRKRFFNKLKSLGLLHADVNEDGIVTWKEIEKSRARYFNHFDLNKDGDITRDEVEAQLRKRMERRARLITGWFDSNSDGKISKEEFNQSAKERFGWRDYNGDNKLSGTELPPRFYRMQRRRERLKEYRQDTQKPEVPEETENKTDKKG
ncbi:MAG: EF-hand domain-containing protein [Methyloligellaceae bacterium]